MIHVPGKRTAVCHSLVELIDLFPATANLCGLEIPQRLQGRDISQMFDDPTIQVRDTAFCVAPSSKGFLLREDKWAYLQYGESGEGGEELFDMRADPHQYTNLAQRSEQAEVVSRFRRKLRDTLQSVRDCDLGQSRNEKVEGNR